VIGSQVAAMLGLGVYVAALAIRGDIDPDGPDLPGQISALLGTPVAMLITVIPTEIALIVIALIPACLSKEPWRQRLGLVRGTLPAWGLLILLPAQLFVIAALQIVFSLLFTEPSEHLEALHKGLTGAAGPLAVVLLLSMSVLPGFAEELLDRGYIQRRLIARWGPLPGIAVTSVFFGLAHVDPQHALMAAMLGVWLGVVAWRTGAVWPAMACHAFGNFLGIGLAMLAGPAAEPAVGSSAMTLNDWLVLFAMLGAGAPFFVASVILLRRCGRSAA
jgi:membrane protease YdiL (CAAX protease family)